MRNAWVCMFDFPQNHVGMALLHESKPLIPINQRVYMYVKKFLQLGFDGL